MKTKIFTLLSLAALTLGLTDSGFAQTKKTPSQASQLVSLLPASDGVAVLDVNRFVNEALPKLLSGNQPLLLKVTSALDVMKTKTGIDLRQFDHVAAGVSFTKVQAKEFDFDAVLIARGRIDAGAMIAAAKLALNGRYREEKIGTKTIYVFAAKEINDQNDKKAAIEKPFGKLSREMAVTVIDTNTIAFGSFARVKEAVEKKSKIGIDLTGFLNRKAMSIMSFAANVPEGMSAFLPLENDELGRNIDSIRYLYGTMAVFGDTTNLLAAARTLENTEAVSLHETLEGLQILGKALLGSSAVADKMVYARLVENVKFTTKAHEVSIYLSISQSDVDVLIGMIK